MAIRLLEPLMVTGPGNSSALIDTPAAVEQHTEWIADTIEHMGANSPDRTKAESSAEGTGGEVTSTSTRDRRATRERAPGRWGPSLPGSAPS